MPTWQQDRMVAVPESKDKHEPFMQNRSDGKAKREARRYKKRLDGGVGVDEDVFGVAHTTGMHVWRNVTWYHGGLGRDRSLPPACFSFSFWKVKAKRFK